MSVFRQFGFWLAFLVGIGLAIPIAIFQFDRAARDNPFAERLVPEGLGGFADARRLRMLLADDPVAAAPMASAVVEHRPVEGEHLGQLAIQALQVDDVELAASALTSAARRGWRNTFVQLSVLASAVEQGEAKEAALRLDALSRIEAPDDVLFQAMDVLLSDPATARELGPLLTQSHFLSLAVIRFADARPDRADGIARIVADIDDYDDALGCEGRARLAYGLLTKGNAVGQRVWPEACHTARTSELAFSYSDTEWEPFGWVFPKSGSISIRIREEGRITIDNRDFLRRLIAWRYLTLDPGTYNVLIDRDDNGSASPTGRRRADVSLSVRCIDEEGREALDLGEYEPGIGLSFEVIENCPVQRLRLEADRGRVEQLGLSLRAR